MYIHEAIYDPAELLRENLHVHTSFSHCAPAGRTLAVILAEAKQAGLSRIAITDHYNTDNSDDKFAAHIATLRQELAGIQTDIKVFFGAELSAYGVGKWLEGDSLRQKLDYRLYACNHYHLAYWEQPEDKSPAGYAKHAMAVATAVIASDHADCIAHPFGPGYIKTEVDKQAICDAITDTMLGDVFTIAKAHQTAIELNAPSRDPWGLQRRIFNTGRECGVVFNYGTDAHKPGTVDTMQYIREVRRVLLG